MSGKSKPSPSVDANPVGAGAAMVYWFTTEAWRIRNPRTLVKETCERLAGAGVPLETFSAFIMTLHPDYFGVVHRWDRATGEVATTQGSHELFETDMVRSSPIRLVMDEGYAAVRRRLDGPGFVADMPVLADYRSAGATDYVVMRMEFSDGSNHAFSVTTNRPGGFTIPQLTLINDLIPYMARLTEIQSVRYLARTLLDTYVGHETGGEILEGRIRRGSVRTIRAIVWMCDLRDFTSLSNTLPGDEMIALLNDYFDCVGKPLAAHGGEILKFIGDAVLAIFRIGADQAPEQMSAAAAGAAHEALAGLDAVNRDRRRDGKAEFRFGVALHMGDVLYGNIGAGDRLDFTVIGPAVNLAARLTGLCRELDTAIVVSSDFAGVFPGRTRLAGRHALRGIEDRQAVYTLA